MGQRGGDSGLGPSGDAPVAGPGLRAPQSPQRAWAGRAGAACVALPSGPALTPGEPRSLPAARGPIPPQ
eukprot:8011322-Pyramimonas_sp.AAC.1